MIGRGFLFATPSFALSEHLWRHASMTEFEELKQEILKFRDARDWMQFHNPKNLACSIAIEAAELLEHFQWKSPEESAQLAKENRLQLAEEIADVAIYVIELCDILEIDLIQAIKAKLITNAVKYPIEKAKGSATKYNKL
jgi:NTP pyrophosphatase (non-canonical NTP hydrolase)